MHCWDDVCVVRICCLGLNPGKWTRGFNQDAIVSVANPALHDLECVADHGVGFGVAQHIGVLTGHKMRVTTPSSDRTRTLLCSLLATLSPTPSAVPRKSD